VIVVQPYLFSCDSPIAIELKLIRVLQSPDMIQSCFVVFLLCVCWPRCVCNCCEALNFFEEETNAALNNARTEIKF
jgi:hypothetical protein